MASNLSPDLELAIYRDEVRRLKRQRNELCAALAEAIRHVKSVDQNSELAIGHWQALVEEFSATDDDLEA